MRCASAVLLMISRLYSSLCAPRFVELGWVECGKGSIICIGIITLPHRINVGPVRSFVRSVRSFTGDIHPGQVHLLRLISKHTVPQVSLFTNETVKSGWECEEEVADSEDESQFGSQQSVVDGSSTLRR